MILQNFVTVIGLVVAEQLLLAIKHVFFAFQNEKLPKHVLEAINKTTMQKS